MDARFNPHIFKPAIDCVHLAFDPGKGYGIFAFDFLFFSYILFLCALPIYAVVVQPAQSYYATDNGKRQLPTHKLITSFRLTLGMGYSLTIVVGRDYYFCIFLTLDEYCSRSR